MKFLHSYGLCAYVCLDGQRWVSAKMKIVLREAEGVDTGNLLPGVSKQFPTLAIPILGTRMRIANRTAG